jgi:hypothetical protein
MQEIVHYVLIATVRTKYAPSNGILEPGGHNCSKPDRPRVSTVDHTDPTGRPRFGPFLEF